jgi:putative endonuclease
MSPAPQRWFYVYLLKSKRDSLIYIGCTSNLHKRLEEHREEKVYSTKKMLPIELIYFEAYSSKKAAFERERRLKHYGSALRHLKLRIGGAG